MRWTRGPVARTALVGVAVVLAGLIPSSGATAGDKNVDVRLAYTCRFPGAPQNVRVRLQALFPAFGTAGAPIRPTGVKLTVTVPRAAVPAVGAPGATAAGSALLSTTTVQNGVTTDARWPALSVPPTTIPADGALRLPAAGSVPASPFGAAGAVTFTAGELTLAIEAQPTDSTGTSSGGPVVLPARTPVTCAPAAGQNTTLTTIAPAPGSPGRTPRSHRSNRPKAAVDTCPLMPTGDLDRSKLPTPPPNSTILEPPVQSPGCAYAAGFSNVQKLNGAALINDTKADPVLTNVAVGKRVVLNPLANYGEQDSIADFDPPPAKATFLTFGFMPTTATMDLTPLRLMTIVSVSQVHTPFDKPFKTTIYASLSLRLYDVSVNGTPLDVGPQCRATQPLDLELVGWDYSKLPGQGNGIPQYSLQSGGVLTGTLEIPSFTGCGVGEDLDPLLTSSISGKGNLVKFTQGKLCTPTSGQNCNPVEIPIPVG